MREAPSYTGKEEEAIHREHCTIVSSLLRLGEDYYASIHLVQRLNMCSRHANGRIMWKNEKGQPLANVYPRK